MAWELDFEDYPVGSPVLRWAIVPWDSDLFEFPVVEIRVLQVKAVAVRKPCLGCWPF